MTRDGGKELQEIISQAKMAINEYDYAEEEIRSSLGNLHEVEGVSPPAPQQNSSNIVHKTPGNSGESHGMHSKSNSMTASQKIMLTTPPPHIMNSPDLHDENPRYAN